MKGNEGRADARPFALRRHSGDVSFEAMDSSPPDRDVWDDPAYREALRRRAGQDTPDEESPKGVSIWRIARNVAGGLLVVLGVVGLALPVLQGVLFLVLGLSLLDFPGKRKLIVRIKSTRMWRRFREIRRERKERKRSRDGEPPDQPTSTSATTGR